MLSERKKAKTLVADMMNAGKPIKLELAGEQKRKEMEDWVVTDIEGRADIAFDLTERFPFSDGCADIIYSSHVLEHFSYPKQTMHVLRECHRILRPGGIFSVSVPDARFYASYYLNPEHVTPPEYGGWDVGLKFNHPIDVLNFIAYLGGDHRHLFDRDNLIEVLEDAGYREVKVRDYEPNLDPEWRKTASIFAVGTK